MGLRRRFSKIFKWSGRRGSNSRRQPWEGCILPLNYVRICYVKDYSTIMLFLGIKFLINQIKNLFSRTGFLFWGGRIRTSGMAGPKPAALPLGDAPIFSYLPDTQIIRNIYSIGHTVSCQELFKQPKLLCFVSRCFIYFIIKAAYVIIRYRIVSKILYPALSDGTELYILTETAYFPFFIHFVLVYHKEILQQNL